MPPIPKPKKSNVKSKRAKCIALSGKIATHSGVCMRCVRHSETDPHLTVPRGHDRTVARTDNQIALCRQCHRYAHDNPDAFRYIIDSLFPGRRLMLEAVARVNGKMDWDAVLDGLKTEAAIAGME